jgi:hypothetical protein
VGNDSVGNDSVGNVLDWGQNSNGQGGDSSLDLGDDGQRLDGDNSRPDKDNVQEAGEDYNDQIHQDKERGDFRGLGQRLSFKLQVFTAPIETPTSGELASFLSFYQRTFQQYGSAGFVRFKVPSGLLGSYPKPTRPSFTTCQRQAVTWVSATVATVEFYNNRNTGAWQIPDPNETFEAGRAIDRWFELFGPGADRELPDYAINIDVRNPRLRTRAGLPRTSAIYPLSGNVLLDSAPNLQGVTTPEAFSSRGFGTVFTLHVEDFEAPSININHCGADKLWIIVAQEDSKKLAATLLRDDFAKDETKCHQYIRHENLFLHPAYLEQNNIRYNCVLQPPGTAILLFPGVAHYGFNLGPNLAEAVNYAPECWVPPELTICRCFKRNPIVRQMFLPKEKIPHDLPPSKKRKEACQRQNTAKRLRTCQRPPHNADPKEWVRYISNFEHFDHTPTLSSSQALRHILALWSRQCILRVCMAVQLWKEDITAKQLLETWRTTPEKDRVQELGLANDLLAKGHLNMALGTILDVLMFRQIRQNHATTMFGDRLENGVLGRHFGIPPDDQKRHRHLQDRYYQSTKLDLLCGDDLGTILMIPQTLDEPFAVSKNTYGRLSIPDIQVIKANLESSTVFCTTRKLANHFVWCILRGEEFPAFSIPLDKLDQMTDGDVVGYLAKCIPV